jgi:hypothetical protein
LSANPLVPSGVTVYVGSSTVGFFSTQSGLIGTSPTTRPPAPRCFTQYASPTPSHHGLPGIGALSAASQ